MTNELFTFKTLTEDKVQQHVRFVRLVSRDQPGHMYNYVSEKLERFGEKFNPADMRTVAAIQGKTIRGTVIVLTCTKCRTSVCVWRSRT